MSTSPPLALVPFSLEYEGLSWTLYRADSTPYIRDLDWAERLGYEHPRQIRELIKRMVNQGRLGVCRTVRQTSGSLGGRPSTEYFLTEGQALKVAAKSETPYADQILDAMIAVFLQARELLRNPTAGSGWNRLGEQLRNLLGAELRAVVQEEVSAALREQSTRAIIREQVRGALERQGEPGIPPSRLQQEQALLHEALAGLLRWCQARGEFTFTAIELSKALTYEGADMPALRQVLSKLCRTLSPHHLGNALRRLRDSPGAGCSLQSQPTRTAVGIVWEIVLPC